MRYRLLHCCAFVWMLGPSAGATAQVSSSSYLNLLPDGETKRRFILDCTGCHQFDAKITDFDGMRKSRRHWVERTAQMIQYFGGSGVFPIMSPSRDAGATADWLVTHLGDSVAPPPIEPVQVDSDDDVTMTEFAIPNPQDLPHDLMIDASGKVVITGMMTHRMYVLDPNTGEFVTTPIPVENANPRALDIDEDGNWWVLLGAPGRIARYEPASSTWASWAIGTYPHSIVRDRSGKVWFNGHFSKDPEIIGFLDPDAGGGGEGAERRERGGGGAGGGGEGGGEGNVITFEIPVESMDDGGSNIPYGLRIAPDGTLWMTELVGNRLVKFDLDSGDGGKFDLYPLPTSFSGPRRPDIAPDGTVWIPEYANNRIARFDPASGVFEEFQLPIRDSLPYIVRVHPETGDVWIATAAADVVYRFAPDSREFSAYPVPTGSALMRHMEIDPATGDVWVAYGNSPAVTPKVLRIQP